MPDDLRDAIYAALSEAGIWDYAVCCVHGDMVLVQIGNWPSFGLYSVADVAMWFDEMAEMVSLLDAAPGEA